MKLTYKQKLDLETVIYFIPQNLKSRKISDRDIEMFFENSDSGKHKWTCNFILWFSRFEKDDYKIWDYTLWELRGLEALLQGKRWRGIHIGEMYEPTIKEMWRFEYNSILVEGNYWRKPRWFWKLLNYFWYDKRIKDTFVPRSVVDFLKKSMFWWRDSEFIENVYKNLLQH